MKAIKTIIAAGIFSSASAAFACLPAPLEYNAQANNLVAVALLNNQHIALTDVERLETSDHLVLEYRWVNSNPGLECHDSSTIAITVSADYLMDDRLCQVQGRVKMDIHTYENAPRNSWEIFELIDSCS